MDLGVGSLLEYCGCHLCKGGFTSLPGAEQYSSRGFIQALKNLVHQPWPQDQFRQLLLHIWSYPPNRPECQG
jgi:hypothetical protein